MLLTWEGNFHQGDSLKNPERESLKWHLEKKKGHYLILQSITQTDFSNNTAFHWLLGKINKKTSKSSL